MKENLRVWVIGSVLVGGAILAGGWFFGAQPLLGNAGQANASAAEADQQNQTLQTRLASLQAAQRNIGLLRAKAAKGAEAVPSSIDAQAFVNRINVLADADDVTVATITPAAPQAYAVPTPNEPGQKVDAFTSTAITASNFVTIPMSVEVTGSAADARTFLGHLQHDSRLFLVNGYTLTKDDTDSTWTATASGYIYALKSSN